MRRALRVQDNAPLWQAMRDAEEVLPVLILGTGATYNEDTPRRRFLRAAIRNLDSNLRSRGSGLCVRTGDPARALVSLAQETGARAVYASRVYDPALDSRERKLSSTLGRHGITWHTFKDNVIFEGLEIATAEGTAYKIYTPYMRAWRAEESGVPPPLPTVRTIRSPRSTGVDLSRIPGFDSRDPIGGETAALARLNEFLKSRASTYDRDRDFPAIRGTSRLSADLANGTISIRTVFHAARQLRDKRTPGKRAGIEAFINQMIWREFYYQILANFPFVADGAFREPFREIRWRNNRRHFDAWRYGQTGYPIIDAAMRQLSEEGWMHNRARMLVASFLTKDLHIDWRHGERHFYRNLVDADAASNNGGWQWAAGTGTDASPYFRIFNPTVQGRKFDPDGDYVRQYIPELAQVPVNLLHEPWKMTRQEQSAASCFIGKDYPVPIVDHRRELAITMELYNAARDPGGVPSPGGRNHELQV